jgi:hypothetical protein
MLRALWNRITGRAEALEQERKQQSAGERAFSREAEEDRDTDAVIGERLGGHTLHERDDEPPLV